MKYPSDPFDLEANPIALHEHRIYGDDRASIWAMVDEEDYQWALRWLWSPKWSKNKKNVYLRRNVQTTHGEADRDQQTGKRVQIRTQQTLFLHIAIMRRTGIEPPSPLHIIVDHRNSDGLDCRRRNLRWATHSMNSLNINGAYAHDLVEG